MKGTRTLSLVLAVVLLLGSITTVSARTGTDFNNNIFIIIRVFRKK